MRILMLGWEFPPRIVGGLGIACAGLAGGLRRLGHEVVFVTPREGEDAPEGEGGPGESGRGGSVGVPAALPSPYGEAGASPYAGDLLAQSGRYADMVGEVLSGERFDVVHAHDWPTYAAGIVAARRGGIPLVAHVHSTEVERAGDAASPAVVAEERRGMHAAARVITVSRVTRDVCVHAYGVPAWKIDVVHNGTDMACGAEGVRRRRGRERTVLFLGRLAAQKGPERFLEAAARVLARDGDVRFVVAGWGDLGPGLVERAAELGIGHRVLFTGVLSREDVARVFALADCFVMPSVAEPFGIAALEAAACGVPVIVDRGAGVAEALAGCVRVDAADAGALAEAIEGVVRRPRRAGALRKKAAEEVRMLTWDRSAAGCVEVYRRALGAGAGDGLTRRPA